MFTFPLDTHMCFSWKSLFLHDLYHVLFKKSNTLIPCPKLSSKFGSCPGNGLFETLSQPKLDQYQAWTFETQTSNLGCAWGRQIYFLGFHKFHISCFPVFPMFLFSCCKTIFVSLFLSLFLIVACPFPPDIMGVLAPLSHQPILDRNI